MTATTDDDFERVREVRTRTTLPRFSFCSTSSRSRPVGWWRRTWDSASPQR